MMVLFQGLKKIRLIWEKSNMGLSAAQNIPMSPKKTIPFKRLPHISQIPCLSQLFPQSWSFFSSWDYSDCRCWCSTQNPGADLSFRLALITVTGIFMYLRHRLEKCARHWQLLKMYIGMNCLFSICLTHLICEASVWCTPDDKMIPQCSWCLIAPLPRSRKVLTNVGAKLSSGQRWQRWHRWFTVQTWIPHHHLVGIYKAFTIRLVALEPGGKEAKPLFLASLAQHKFCCFCTIFSFCKKT